jgi:hypothetical protein
VAAADLEAAVVVGDDQILSYTRAELGYGEMPHAANESEHRHMVQSEDA